MAFALIVLAIGSVVAGYVGVPHALGGNNRIERFLAPSFGEHHDFVMTHGEESGAASELTLMAASSGIAIAGIAVAAYFFLRRRDAADSLARRFAGVHRLLANKYYVDELYDGVIIQPLKRLSTRFLWGNVDARLIDGAVNGTGRMVAGLSSLLRLVQSGSVRTYAASLFAGVVLILGYYLWR